MQVSLTNKILKDNNGKTNFETKRVYLKQQSNNLRIWLQTTFRKYIFIFLSRKTSELTLPSAMINVF